MKNDHQSTIYLKYITKINNVDTLFKKISEIIFYLLCIYLFL
jgi:hypothetical protein